jgi:succinate-semialdehyde dehydrogenase/glutarate-semialdehyde dehydrogenase
VDKVFFTGSVATGRRVSRACAERLVPCVLELGGSDPAIVLDDADLPTAASGITWGRFSNAGQTCVAPKRVFVVDAVYERFVDELSRRVRGLTVGPGAADGTDVGPIIRPSQIAQLQEQLDDALRRGARVVAQAPTPTGGWFFPPTVLADVTPEMRVLREETFGPILPVVRVRDAEEAVRRANESEFGLSASVWSRDAQRASALARRLEAGSVTVNDAIIAAGMADVPHGGVKASGSGRSHGLAGLLECVRTHTVIADRWAGWRQPWWYGYSPAHAENLEAFTRLAHGDTVGTRLSGVWRTLRMLWAPDRPMYAAPGGPARHLHLRGRRRPREVLWGVKRRLPGAETPPRRCARSGASLLPSAAFPSGSPRLHVVP